MRKYNDLNKVAMKLGNRKPKSVSINQVPNIVVRTHNQVIMCEIDFPFPELTDIFLGQGPTGDIY